MVSWSRNGSWRSGRCCCSSFGGSTRLATGLGLNPSERGPPRLGSSTLSSSAGVAWTGLDAQVRPAPRRPRRKAHELATARGNYAEGYRPPRPLRRLSERGSLDGLAHWQVLSPRKRVSVARRTVRSTRTPSAPVLLGSLRYLLRVLKAILWLAAPAVPLLIARDTADPITLKLLVLGASLLTWGAVLFAFTGRSSCNCSHCRTTR